MFFCSGVVFECRVECQTLGIHEDRSRRKDHRMTWRDLGSKDRHQCGYANAAVSIQGVREQRIEKIILRSVRYLIQVQNTEIPRKLTRLYACFRSLSRSLTKVKVWFHYESTDGGRQQYGHDAPPVL